MTRVNAAVIGASGYSGGELLKILLKHPGVDLTHLIGASTVGKRLDALNPFFRTKTDLTIEAYDLEILKSMDFVFLALPHGEAMKRVPELVDAGVRTIDFSGDFRCASPAVYEHWYGLPHCAPDYLPRAVYGLPELYKEEIQRCRLLANPGCYPTSAILALAPIVAQDFVNSDAIAITSMSGTSGAGRKADLSLMFSECNETVKAYKVGTHQHTPEIAAVLERLAGRKLEVVFIPHLVPLTRGIYTTISLPLTRTPDQDEITALYQDFYQDAPFVRVLEMPPQIRWVSGTNSCDIHVAVDMTQRFVTITAAIDNLLKGAAGQAVQNMNIMAGFPEQEGL